MEAHGVFTDSGLLPLEDFPDVRGEFRHVKRDIRLATFRHMPPLGHYQVSLDIV